MLVQRIVPKSIVEALLAASTVQGIGKIAAQDLAPASDLLDAVSLPNVATLSKIPEPDVVV